MLKLLAVADLHLGRRPVRLAGSLAERAAELGPAAAWKRTVDEAIREGIDVVALAGDVVEREEDFFEAYRLLRDGADELARADVRVVAVAGNHDLQVLPRLADELPEFRLLGRDGRWECTSIEAGGERLALWGWSFTERQSMRSPLADHRFERRPGLNLGLLHCDRDQSGSRYAPVRSRELDEAGLDGWLLGHVHRPDALTAERPSGYLGSIVGLDPTESGARGPWLFRIERGRVASVEQWVLAPLRWESPEVDVGGIADPAEARNRLIRCLEQLDQQLASARHRPEAVGLRLTLVGRTRWGGRAAELLSQGEDGEPVFVGVQGTQFFVDRIRVATRPEIDLEKLAERTDPPGLLARHLLSLEQEASHAGRQALVAEARRRLGRLAAGSPWAQLDRPAIGDEEAAGYLRRAGLELLERLLAQTESADAAD